MTAIQFFSFASEEVFCLPQGMSERQ